jgi:RNA polymerase sigma-70 factor, ECF subfamily
MNGASSRGGVPRPQAGRATCPDRGSSSTAVNTQEEEPSIGPDDGSGEQVPGPGGSEGASGGSAAPDGIPADLPIAPDVRPPEERARDLELVQRAQKGDRQAFRELFDRYHKRAFSVAYGVLKHRQDSLDVVQEAFVKVHKHLASFQGSSSFYTWLYRIVMNLAIDHLRRRRTGRSVEYDDAILRGEEAGESSVLPRMLEANPRKAVIRRELLEKVQAALAELPDIHQQVILLREIEGLSYEEMAEALEVPKGTIMSRLFHARKKMQAALAGYVDGDMDIEE